jgi:hypothetical protein
MVSRELDGKVESFQLPENGAAVERSALSLLLPSPDPAGVQSGKGYTGWDCNLNSAACRRFQVV